MYDSQPKEREGEDLEQVLPTAVHTTSSAGQEPMPQSNRPVLASLHEAARGPQGYFVKTAVVLAVIATIELLVILTMVLV